MDRSVTTEITGWTRARRSSSYHVNAEIAGWRGPRCCRFASQYCCLYEDLGGAQREQQSLFRPSWTKPARWIVSQTPRNRTQVQLWRRTTEGQLVFFRRCVLLYSIPRSCFHHFRRTCISPVCLRVNLEDKAMIVMECSLTSQVYPRKQALNNSTSQ